MAAGFKDGILKLKLIGSCSSCPSSSSTLKGGVENLLMHYVPELVAVEEVTDETDDLSQKEFQALEQRLRGDGGAGQETTPPLDDKKG